MHPRRRRSLKTVVFIHEAALLCLVVLTGLMGGGAAYFWAHSSAESLRLHTLLSLSEQMRGELYAQIQEAFRVRVLEDPNALEIYTAHSRSIDRHFNALRQQSDTEQEALAIQGMQRAYRELQQDMNRIFHDPYSTGRPARVMILNPEMAEEMVGRFEDRHVRFKALLADARHELDKWLYNWSRLAPVLISLVVLFAILLVLLTRRTVRKEFISPMSAVIEGARTLSQGRLEHSIPDAGVAEISSLAGALNGMASDLQRSRDALVESERQAALGSLVPMVAHNIRNPLASMRATAQLIHVDDDPEELLESRNAIIATIDRLGRWVNALVSYLHPLQPKLRPIMASRLLQATLDMVSEKLRAKTMRVQRGGWECDRELKADPDLMEQALYALTQNAIDASPEGGTLGLHMALREGYLELHVIDNGAGLPFTPESGRLEPGPSTKRYGTGLGIPIAFRICKTHGWNIQFEDTEGGGTKVIIAAPLSEISSLTSSD